MAADSPPKTSIESLAHLVVHLLSDRVNSMDTRLQFVERTLMTRSTISQSNEETGTSMGTTPTAPRFGRAVAHIKRLWAAASTLSIWGKVLMWLAPRAVIMWGIAQGWLQASWRWLQGWLLALF